MTFLISAMVVQWSILVGHFFMELQNEPALRFVGRTQVTMLDLVNGLFAAATAMISYGAILGKTSPSQLVIMGFMETMFYWLNVYINSTLLGVIDIGGGMFIHAFGAYFGMTITFFFSKRMHGHPDNTPAYYNDIFSFAGTLFLFIMWPSFNAATAAPGTEQLRAILNTFLSLTAAIISTFVFSRAFSHREFEPDHIQNATLAGGVVMGVVANLNLPLAVVIFVGFIAGATSTAGFHFMSPFLNELGFQDVCGVHNLHGMPGILAGILSILATTGLAYQENTPFTHGVLQGGYQAAGLVITFGISITGGLITALLMRACDYLGNLAFDDFFNDSAFWNVPANYYTVGEE